MINLAQPSLTISAEQFEAEVEGILRNSGIGLSDFKVQRLEKIHATDGIYEIDVTARFKALGDVLVLIECKHHKSPIKREVVQLLYDKLRAVGAQKGMIFSTVRYQKGAIEFARAHGIALVLVTDGTTNYVTRSSYPQIRSRPTPPLAWLANLSGSGRQTFRRILNNDAALLIPRIPLAAKHDLPTTLVE
jgi:restriction system protein